MENSRVLHPVSSSSLRPGWSRAANLDEAPFVVVQSTRLRKQSVQGRTTSHCSPTKALAFPRSKATDRSRPDPKLGHGRSGSDQTMNKQSQDCWPTFNFCLRQRSHALETLLAFPLGSIVDAKASGR
jgi:hypothetical protein